MGFEEDVFIKAVAEINAINPDMIILTGDLTNNGWRRDIAVRRSKRVQPQIFFVLHLSNLRFGFAALLYPFLDILHGRQLVFQFFRQIAGDLIGTDTDGFAHVLERILGHKVILALAEQQAD